MAENSESINQDEIEELLRQAQAIGDDAAQPAGDTPGDDARTLDPSEISAILDSVEGAAALAEAQTALADASPGSSDQGIGQADIDLLLNQAEAALASLDGPGQPTPPDVAPFQLKDFTGSPPSSDTATLDLVRDVPLDLNIELGRTHMKLEDVLRLRKGAVVPLNKLAGDPVDIFANGRLIARGEVLVLNDNFCVRVAELIVGESAVA